MLDKLIEVENKYDKITKALSEPSIFF